MFFTKFAACTGFLGFETWYKLLENKNWLEWCFWALGAVASLQPDCGLSVFVGWKDISARSCSVWFKHLTWGTACISINNLNFSLALSTTMTTLKNLHFRCGKLKRLWHLYLKQEGGAYLFILCNWSVPLKERNWLRNLTLKPWDTWCMCCIPYAFVELCTRLCMSPTAGKSSLPVFRSIV